MSTPDTMREFADIEVVQNEADEVMPSLTLNEDDILGQLIDGRLAIEQTVRRILATERYSSSLYDLAYGVELEELYGMDMEFVKIDVERRITEALLQDDRIIEVENFQMSVEDNILHLSFDVITLAGTIQDMEVDLIGNS